MTTAKSRKDKTDAAANIEFERRQMLSIFDSIDEGIYISDPENYEILFANRATKKIFGDIVGRKCYEALQGRKSPCPFCTNKLIFGENEGKTHVWEFRNESNKRWYRCIDHAILWPDGRLVRYEMAIDITNTKIVEEALRQSEEKYRDLYDSAPDMYHTIDSNGVIIGCNQTEARMLGYSQDEIIGRPLMDFFTAESKLLFKQDFPPRVSKGATLTVEREFVRKDGSTFPASLHVYPEFDDSGRLLATKTIARDITRIKETEEALRQSEEQFRAISEAADDAIIYLDAQGLIAYWNPAAEKIFGYTEEEVRAKDMHLLFAPAEYHEAYKKGFQHFQKTGKGPAVGMINEFPARKKDGTKIPVEIVFSVIRSKGEYHAVGIIRDITERKKAEQALLESEKKFRDLFENSRDAIYVVNREGVFVDANQACLEMFCLTKDELLGSNVIDLYVNRADRPAFQAAIEKNGFVKDYEIKMRKRSGPEMTCLVTSAVRRDSAGRIIGYQGITRDISETRRLQLEALKAEKLESTGILAGGIAHDFNNLLTAILGNISLVKADLNPDDKIYERLEQAEKASLLARDLTRQLLTFAKGGQPIKETADLKELIEDAAGFVLRGSNVSCEYFLSEELWPAEVDTGQFAQVIQNLVINANQAMPEGGTVSISAENLIADNDNSLKLAAGRYLKISVHDHGIGIPESHLTKIFDPYFSTKKKGSGLGLTSSYSIIKNHNGLISVESAPETGTIFHVYLPASDKKTPAPKKAATEPQTGEGRILVMDDDEMVREIIDRMLRRLGYETVLAANGQAALEIYKSAQENGQGFDVVILDLTVPGGLGGVGTLRKLLDFDPGARAIVSSGYSNDPIMSNYRNFGFCGVAPKPYRIEQLSSALQACLEQKNGGRR